MKKIFYLVFFISLCFLVNVNIAEAKNVQKMCKLASFSCAGARACYYRPKRPDKASGIFVTRVRNF